MGRTIGRKWRGTRNPPALCDYCGVKWPSDQLTRDVDGKLRCPDEGNGPCAGELSRGAADGALEARTVEAWRRP